MNSQSFWTSNRALPAYFLIGAVVYFLLMEHRQHLFQWLPFLIIGLCPLMHIFMHKNHNHPEPVQLSDVSEQDAYKRGLEDGLRQSNRDHRS